MAANIEEAMRRIEECWANKSVVLDLSMLELTEIPDLSALTWLEYLDLSNNKINEIKGLNGLSGLIELNLLNNQIREIKGLGDLFGLVELNLSENKIHEINGLDGLVGLNQLFLWDNEIDEIKGLSGLFHLYALYLPSNQIREIKGLDGLFNLEFVSLSDNQISEIGRGLDGLPTLKELYLSDNLLSSLESCWLRIFEQLHHLEVDGNAELEARYDLELGEFENHIDIIRAVWQREQEGFEVVLPAKVLLLGNHAAGKSSLLHYLKTKDCAQNTPSTPLLKVESYFISESQNKSLPDAVFYDFGGQDFYHGIYRAFLDEQASKILVFDPEHNLNKLGDEVNGGEDAALTTHYFDLDYWFGQMQHAHAGREVIEAAKRVLLVQSHASSDGVADYHKIPADLPYQVQLHHVALCDNTANPLNLKALEYLKACVDDVVRTGQKTRKEPRWYTDFLNYIYTQNRKSGARAHYATGLKSLLEHFKKTDATLDDLKLELKQLNAQGLVIYDEQIAAEKAWLNPQAVVLYVHEQVLSQAILREQHGVINAVQMKALKLSDDLLALLIHHQIVFKHEVSKAVEYIVPNYLKRVQDDQAIYDLSTFGMGQPSFVLHFEQFIPMGLINQLICFFGLQPEHKLFWRDQLVFTLSEGLKQSYKVLIRLDMSTLEIKVYVKETEAIDVQMAQVKAYLFYCLMCFYWDREPYGMNEYAEFKRSGYMLNDKEFHEKLRKDGFIAGVWVWADFYNEEQYQPKDLWVSNNGTHFVKYTDLVKHAKEQAQEPSIVAHSGASLSQEKSVSAKPFEIFVKQELKAMKKVFISYSKDDLRMVHRFLDALVPLHDQGIIENPWYCTLLEAGSDWSDEIQSRLKEADIVFFMCSMSFIRTKYIREHEIKVAKELGKTIIPVVLNYCSWTDYLGATSALPYQGHPIADYRNEDMAWHLVERGVRAMLETDSARKQELDKEVKEMYQRQVSGTLYKGSENDSTLK